MIWLLPCLFGFLVNADMYLQYPMGSNNRLDDENRDRNNANRMCDTQNNNRGGYNVGNVFFYQGTHVPIKWTAQHSCGNPNNHCEIIIQMMCDDRLRDGTTQNTIPDNPVECYNWDCDTDVRYGRHESFDFYQTCKKTSRNKGLFLADQNLKGESARYTRQNPNGARRGYECPEERDYYPYWRPSPWVDLAYFTNQPGVCNAVVTQSQNVLPRHYCAVRTDFLYMEHLLTTALPINQAECEALQVEVEEMVPRVDEAGEPVLDPETQEQLMDTVTQLIYPGQWRQDLPDDAPLYPKSAALAQQIGQPACGTNIWSRDNHHGNVAGGDFASFDWTVPNIEEENCVLRIRYNISTGDLPHLDENLETTPPLDLETEGRYTVAMAMGFHANETADTEDGYGNGYYFKNNPQVRPFYNYQGDNGGTPVEFVAASDNDSPLEFQLAINTAQYGRTFQDRSHRIEIKKRPANVPASAKIWNLGVRGKRGNIVQTYPGTEYSFVPEELEAAVNDYVHIQWVGSNTNPNNNAGQGRQGSDRHNIATLRNRGYEEAGQNEPWVASGSADNTYGQFGSSYPAYIGNDPFSENYNGGDPDQRKLSEFLGFSNRQRKMLADLKGINTNGGELSELDDSGTYANFPPMQITKTGFYHYLCTRNNNFSNRSQKGKIKVVPSGMQTISSMITYSGATVEAGGASLTVGSGSVEQGTLEFQPMGMQDQGFCSPNCGSMYYRIPSALPSDAASTASIPYDYAADKVPAVYYTSSSSVNADNWDTVEGYECSGSVGSDGVCTFTPKGAGIYVVYNEVSWWVYLLSVLAILVFLCIVGFLFKRFKGSS